MLKRETVSEALKQFISQNYAEKTAAECRLSALGDLLSEPVPFRCDALQLLGKLAPMSVERGQLLLERVQPVRSGPGPVDGLRGLPLQPGVQVGGGGQLVAEEMPLPVALHVLGPSAEEGLEPQLFADVPLSLPVGHGRLFSGRT